MPTNKRKHNYYLLREKNMKSLQSLTLGDTKEARNPIQDYPPKSILRKQKRNSPILINWLGSSLSLTLTSPFHYKGIDQGASDVTNHIVCGT